MQPVCHADDREPFAAATAGLTYLPPVPGGASRQASVRAGLKALAELRPDIVLIHDAARPFVSEAVITRAIAAAQQTGAALPTVAVADTIKQVDASGHVVGTPARADLRIAQTRSRSASPAFLPRTSALSATGGTISPMTRRWPNGPD